MAEAPGPAPAPWRIAMASSIGTSHLAAGEPCQDSHFHLQARGPAGQTPGRTVEIFVAADGAGTAIGAELGATLACSTFAWLVEAYVTEGGEVRRIGRPLVQRWIAGVSYRLAEQAERQGRRRQDLACTLLAAIVDERAIAFIQIGDGAIVTSGPGDVGWRYVFWPQHGEFANTTNFVTADSAGSTFEFALTTDAIEEIAIFTDGLENLVLQKAKRTVFAPFFDSMFPPVRKSTASGVDAALSAGLEKYLATKPVTDRTDDDKTLILASRRR
jgi:hypothetical protein